ncbi:hypothetical protein ACPWT1_04455 [Ramlibacter sp. MMS24-I3-19]|uniref:hypothetical protein n=1 Tax=Ramlibacter sp. MMS24-I3-19 TaxID=3416606 RepID=UPI003CFE9C4C
MSLLSMFTRKKSSEDEAAPSSGLVQQDPTLPLHRPGAEAAAVVSRRTQRSARRELLYTVVRDCMNRAGVLSASYKFKVLSLDARGRQFFVMVDLPGAHMKSADRLAEIEAMVAQAAKARHDIGVKAVYWRQNDHVAVGLAAATAAAPEQPAKTAPATRPAKVAAAVEPKVAEPVRSEPVQGTLAGYEPIGVEEMTAFRQALANGSKQPKVQGPQSYTLLTGFENTEIHEEPPRALSSSQYGDLR